MHYSLSSSLHVASRFLENPQKTREKPEAAGVTGKKPVQSVGSVGTFCSANFPKNLENMQGNRGTLVLSQDDREPNRLSIPVPAAQDFVTGDNMANTIGFGAFAEPFLYRAEKAKQIAMRLTPESLSLKPLSEAMELWWEYVKEPTVRKPRTAEFYRLCLKNFRASEIGKVPCSALNVGHLMAYQIDRRKQVSVSYVNHETNIISQVLRYCDMWDHIGKHFKQLPPPDWRPPKVLTEEQEEHFFKVAAANKDWKVAYWAVSLTNNTSASGSELRMLQFKHVFIDGEWKKNPKIHVPDQGAKNQFRARVIPLNEVALKQIGRIMDRARGYGAGVPDSYLFPKMIKRNQYDPMQAASRSFIRKAFKELRTATGYDWLQPRNFRNQILTKLFENGTPDETITAIAGHTSINMSKWYSQIRLDAKKDALSAIMPKKKAVSRA